MLKGHGSDIYNYNSSIIADFSSNVWYDGMPEGLVGFLSEKFQNIIHYPSPDAEELSIKLANLHRISSNNVLATNGATEAFYLLAQLYFGVNSYIRYPSFSEYEDAARIFNHTLNFISHSEFESTVKYKKDSMVWIGNPNNPDGKITPVDHIKILCKENPACCFIIDEAYVDLSDKCDSSIRLIPDYGNLVIVKSLTKSFAIPGLRLGYLVASSKIIEKLKAIKMPWSVNTLAIEAGNYILSDYDNFLPKKDTVTIESKKLQKKLSQLSDIKITLSDCNYFLASVVNRKVSELKQFLIDEHGFLIRDASNFRGLNESHFRIAAQKPEFNDTLVRAIKDWMS